MEISQGIVELAAAALATQKLLEPSGMQIVEWEVVAHFQATRVEGQSFEFALSPVLLSRCGYERQMKRHNLTVKILVESSKGESNARN